MSQLYLKWDKVYVQGQHKCRGFIVEKKTGQADFRNQQMKQSPLKKWKLK